MIWLSNGLIGLWDLILEIWMCFMPKVIKLFYYTIGQCLLMLNKYDDAI